MSVTVFNKDHELKKKELLLVRNKLAKQKKIFNDLQSKLKEIEAEGHEPS